MAFRLVDGKLMRVDGKFSFKRLDSLTLTVSDAGFPIVTTSSVASFGVISEKPIRMILITDEQSFYFESTIPNGSYYSLSITSNGASIPGFNSVGITALYSSVNFSNPLGSTKTISLKFDNIDSLVAIQFQSFDLYGSFPNEIKNCSSLQKINLGYVRYLTAFPEDLAGLVSLSNLSLFAISQYRLSKIPDSFFNLNLTIFRSDNIFDLSNIVSSNAFKINQFTNLRQLELTSSLMNDLPTDWIVFKESLEDLRIAGNSFNSFPTVIDEFKKLKVFYCSLIGTDTKEWFDMSGFYDLSLVSFSNNTRLDDISISWQDLYSLNRFVIFKNFTFTNERFDEFIDQFYILCTVNGSITNNSGQFATYPNRFRNISWGDGSLSFTGAKVAPAGYVQGVSNGTPTNQGQKVYVLQNQYGHLIDHAI